MATASSTSSKGMAEMTGPKISSWAMRMSLVTLAKRVGSTYQPVSWPAGRPPPTTTSAPSSWPCTMYFSTRSRWRSATSGPTSVSISAGSPTLTASMRVARPSTTSSYLAVLARTRVWATQAWPLFMRPATWQQAVEGGVDVGVVEDDRRRLAAQLEGVALELLAADARRSSCPPRWSR